ncbi:MAG: hypothetical protein OCD02_17185 [Spirochaetaceae bacterium]
MANSYHETFKLTKGMSKKEVNDFFANEHEGKRLLEKSLVKKQVKEDRMEEKEFNKRFNNN